VVTGVLAAEAAAVQAGFLSRIRLGRPMVTLKLATSFDGRIATASGESRWITGEGARHLVHAMRARHDAVLVGGGTLRTDDPLLTVRGMGALRQPVRIVASAGLNLPLGRLAGSVPEGPVWLLHGGGAPVAARAAWEAAGARLLPVALGGGGLDPAAMLLALGQAGLTRVFCEGGGQLAAALLAAGLVDEVIGFTAGLALGAGGLPSLGALPEGALAEAPRFTLAETGAVGGDVLHRWRRI